VKKESLVLHYAVGDLRAELATTRRILERAPAAQYEWRPHEKSFSLGHLVAHITELLWWGITTLEEDGFDAGAPRPPRESPKSTEDLLVRFDGLAEKLLGLVEALTEEGLEKPWTLRNGDMVWFTNTKGNVLRQWCISHLAHHRGQLSVYVRLLDVPVPSSYGPTADEQ